MPGRSIPVSISPLSHTSMMLACSPKQNRHEKRDGSRPYFPDDSFVERRLRDCIANVRWMKVRNISLADVAHETARCPTRMLPHHAGARLDEFVLEFEAREGPHDLVHVRFFDHREIGTHDIRPG